tara:strand:+ start:3772 stop:4242 length:471 start_codon:yes stop_codon:yes gene_type:complete
MIDANDLDDKLSKANKNQTNKLSKIMKDALEEVFSVGDEDHLQVLFTSCVALKSLIVEHIDPNKLVSELDTDTFSVRRALACIEAMRKIQKLEDKLQMNDVLRKSAEVLGVEDEQVDNIVNKAHKDKDQDREVEELTDKLAKGALDVFKSTESGKA